MPATVLYGVLGDRISGDAILHPQLLAQWKPHPSPLSLHDVNMVMNCMAIFVVLIHKAMFVIAREDRAMSLVFDFHKSHRSVFYTKVSTATD